jgi:MoaA/NifB/PqqE/SkfB family radical SAM enzyme
MCAVETKQHPCFSVEAAKKFARIHLPVAPKCNIKCTYCNRKFDCVNESRPGVTSAVLSPQEGLARYLDVKKRMPYLTIVGVAGPGDALANPERTFETFRLIREADPSVDFCLSTNGLALVENLERLKAGDVRYITVTINTRRVQTARTLYAWASAGNGLFLKGEAAAERLLERQEQALDALKGQGFHVKINTICVPGVNDGEIESLAEWAKSKGADILNVMPFIPTPGTFFERFPMVSREALTRIRNQMEKILPQMKHCQQCRADAVGTVLNENPLPFTGKGPAASVPTPAPKCSPTGAVPLPGEECFRFAVASGSGYTVDLHFGHAKELLIYSASRSGVRFLERREIGKYCSGETDCGTAEDRLTPVLRAVSDCSAILVMRIGDVPRRALAEKGIHVSMTCNRIEEAIRESFEVVASRKAAPSESCAAT